MSGFVRDCNLYGRLVFDVSVTAVGHLVACRQSAVGRRAISSRQYSALPADYILAWCYCCRPVVLEF